MSISLQAQAGATLTAGFGGTAANAAAADGAYLTTNTTAGSAVTIITVDFPGAAYVQTVALLAAAFNDSVNGGIGVATWTPEGSSDNGASWAAIGAFSMSGVATANYAPQTVNQVLTNVRLRATGFGTNGVAVIDCFDVVGLQADLTGSPALAAVATAAAGTVSVAGSVSALLAPLTLAGVGDLSVKGAAAVTLAPINLAADGGRIALIGMADLVLGPLGVAARLFKWDQPMTAPPTWTPATAPATPWSMI